jgi:hypothetical protein
MSSRPPSERRAAADLIQSLQDADRAGRPGVLRGCGGAPRPQNVASAFVICSSAAFSASGGLTCPASARLTFS